LLGLFDRWRLIAATLLLAFVAQVAPAFAQGSADVEIIKTGPAVVAPGESFDYTITVNNLGPDNSDPLDITDQLPAGIILESVVTDSPTEVFCTTGGDPVLIDCFAFGITFGDPGYTITVSVQLDENAEPGSEIDNTANVVGDPGSKLAPPRRLGQESDPVAGVNFPDNNPANNSSTHKIRVAGADLTIDKSHAGAAVRGQQITYSVVVTNIGTAATLGTTSVTDALPAGLTAVSITGGAGWTCTLATLTCDFAGTILAGNGVPAITVVASVDGNAPNTVLNTATVTVGNDVNAGNNTASDQTAITSSSDVSVTKTGPGAVLAGSNITYAIDVANAGPSPATGVSLTDPLPANVTFVSLTSPGGWACTTPAVGANGTVTCTVASLAAGGAAQSFTLVGQVDVAAVGNITNTATVASTSPDANAANNTDSTTAAVTALSADLSITKTGAPTANVGDTLTYTINVANAGPNDASVLVLSDPLPPGITFVSLSAPGGWTCTTPAVGANGTITCNLAALANGASSGPFTLVGLVTPAAAGTVSNTATVGGAEADATPGNNSASVSTDIIAAPPPPPPTSLSLALGFSSPTYTAVGQVIEVRYLVTNTSTVPVNGIGVTDPKVPLIVCPGASLAVGTSMTCTGNYTIVPGDIIAGVSPFTATATDNAGASATASGAITLVTIEIGREFIETRLKMLNPDPPGLHDRIGSANASLGESNGDPTLNFSASVLTGAGEAAASLADGSVQLPVKLWIDGKFTLHTRDNGGGGFGLLGLGGDYLVNENLLLGAALYIDWMSDLTPEGRISGTGYLVGPYISAALGRHFTFDGAIFYGGSMNTADVTIGGAPYTGTFNSDRWVARARIDGQFGFENLVIRPDATMFLRTETTGDYAITDAAGNPVAVAGFTTTNLDVSGGTLIERPIDLENGLTFIPRVGLRAGVTGTGSGTTVNDPYGTASVGFILEGDHWKLDTSVEGSLWASSLRQLAYKAALSGEF
jgi:uncharacterized repeat protein (TIGR01451 family)